MVFAVADPARDRSRIAANVEWLERAQIKDGDPQSSHGSWTYTDMMRGRPGDNSNTQFALLGLSAANDVGVPVDPSVWQLARSYWDHSQQKDGSWAYTPASRAATASMTCAGISNLVITRPGRPHVAGQEDLEYDAIRNCGHGRDDRPLQRGIDWMTGHCRVDQNFGAGVQWRFYYLYGLERAGRLTGRRYLGGCDWYREGAIELVQLQNKLDGSWQGKLVESQQVLATSFALLFLGKGRAPVLINKLRHLPADDWDNDPDDVRNLVGVVSRDWNSLVTWQVVDVQMATVRELRRRRSCSSTDTKPRYSQLRSGEPCESTSRMADSSSRKLAAAAPTLMTASESSWPQCFRANKMSCGDCPTIIQSGAPAT